MKDLTKYNYDDLVAKVTELLKDKEGWGDGYQSSIGQTLIQLLADTTDNLHYLLERRSIEGFLHHARLESSVISRASELGYRPFRSTAHTGTLELKIKDENGNFSPPVHEVFLPKNTTLRFEDRTFHTTSAVMMKDDQYSIEIPVGEGSYVEEEYPLSDLNEMGELVIQDWKQIDEYSLTVRTGSVEWQDVREDRDVNKRALSFLGKDDKAYDIKYTTDGMHIVFGDGWFGAVPDDSITISYTKVENIPEIFAIGKTFIKEGGVRDNYDSSIIYDAVIENITPIVGGKDSESVDSIRRNATTYNQTNGRGVTNTDYEFWTRRANIGGILDVNVFGEEELDSYVYNANNVYITYANATLTPLSTTDRKSLREYLDNIKTTQAHLVISPATKYDLVINTSVRKNSNIPMALSHTYNMIYDFVRETFKTKIGAIGGVFHNSDVINDFYGIKYVDNGIGKQLVDFVKWDMKIGIPFQFPSPVRRAMVGIDNEIAESLPVGREWVVIVDGIICKVTVLGTDTITSLLLRMRDVIRELTQIDARLVAEGAAIDDDGNFSVIEIEPDVGYHLLIGKEHSNRNIGEIIHPVPNSTGVAEIKLYSPGFSIKHYYYNPLKGFRPTIPMRDSTTIKYTPLDTRVEVWVKESYDNNSDFVLHRTIEIGEAYEETFTNIHLLKFNQLSDSREDTVVDIEYSKWDGIRVGIDLKHVNMHSYFTVDVETGGFKDDAFVDYKLAATRPSSFLVNGTPLIEKGTVEIYDNKNDLIATDDGEGKFIATGDIDVAGGRLNYLDGVITPPNSLSDGKKYLITYKQDKYDNIHMGDSDILKLTEIATEENDVLSRMSNIRII